MTYTAKLVVVATLVSKYRRFLRQITRGKITSLETAACIEKKPAWIERGSAYTSLVTRGVTLAEVSADLKQEEKGKTREWAGMRGQGKDGKEAVAMVSCIKYKLLQFFDNLQHHAITQTSTSPANFNLATINYFYSGVCGFFFNFYFF